MAGLVNAVFLGVLASFPVVFSTAVFCSSGPKPCNVEFAEKGVGLCDEAFKNAFSYNREQIIKSPKRVGCCLSHNMGMCLRYAYTSARCALSEFNVDELVSERTLTAQNFINEEAKYLGNVKCDDPQWEKCEHIMREYSSAMSIMEEINGANVLKEEFGLTTLLMVLVIFFECKQF